MTIHSGNVLLSEPRWQPNLSEQIQLLVERLYRPLGREGRAFSMVGARDFVFLAKTCDQLRQTLAVRGRKKSAVLIALAIVLGEMREVLFEEGKEYGRGLRHFDFVEPGFPG